LYTRLFPAVSSFQSALLFDTSEWLICSQFTLPCTPRAEALKSGIHRSITSIASFTTGFLWKTRLQHKMFGGVPVRLVKLAHSWQMVSFGTSLTMAHTPALQPWSRPRQV
jgi:hypothetical protein